MQPDLRIYHDADKTFPTKPQWKRRDRERLVLVSPLDIDGVTIEGLLFRATALALRPEESVTFQLEYFPPKRQPRGGPMERIEWRPLRAHNNKMLGPPHLHNVLQRCTHHHDFQLNWTHSQTAVRKGDLPISIPIEPEPSLNEILEFVGKAFRISPIGWVPPPPWPQWQADLF